MSKATNSECVFDLLFTIADIGELLMTADAAKLRACWVLSVIMESKLVICSNKLFHGEGLSHFWLLYLM